MAKILKTEDQNNALATINKNLKSVASINSILSSKDDTGELIYIIAGDKLKLPVPVVQITPLLTGIRKTMADEAKQLSKQYFINLDRDDISILQGKTVLGDSYEQSSP